jgi:predicted nucleotide-binding protein
MSANIGIDERQKESLLASAAQILSEKTWDTKWLNISRIFGFSDEAKTTDRFIRSQGFHDDDYPERLFNFLESSYNTSPSQTIAMIKYVFDELKKQGVLGDAEIMRYPIMQELFYANNSAIQKESTKPNIANYTNSLNVFVVHGRNLNIRDAMFQFLRSIGLKPIEWSQAVSETGKASPYIGEVLDKAFNMAQAVIVLMTPDDEGKLNQKFQKADDLEHERTLTPQARLNVVFEAGLAMGRDQKRTLLLEFGKLRPFSDIGGRHVLRMNNSSAKRQELAQRLQTAGCAVDLSGTDWHTCGNLDSL